MLIEKKKAGVLGDTETRVCFMWDRKGRLKKLSATVTLLWSLNRATNSWAMHFSAYVCYISKIFLKIHSSVSTVELVLKFYRKCKIHNFEVIFSLCRFCGLERALSEITYLVLLFITEKSGNDWELYQILVQMVQYNTKERDWRSSQAFEDFQMFQLAESLDDAIFR